MAIVNVARGRSTFWNSGNFSGVNHWDYKKVTDGLKSSGSTSTYIDGGISTDGKPVKVTLDLGARYYVHEIKVWHYSGRSYYDAIVEVSPDNINWTTIFDSKVSGRYNETSSGKTHTFPPRLVKYVRDGIRGSNANSSNHWVELEVWADDSYVPPDTGERKVRFSQFI